MSYRPPILLKTTPRLEVDERLYYEVASNGIFQVKEAPWFRAVTRVTREVPGLYPSQERLDLDLLSGRQVPVRRNLRAAAR